MNDKPPYSGQLQTGPHAVAAPLYDRDQPWWDLPEYKMFNKVPIEFAINTILGGAAASTVEGNVPLEPQPFLLKRITYATSGDVLTDAQFAAIEGAFFTFPTYSLQARSVEIKWGDEFTRFMGKQAALVAAMFADSWGYLDLPAPIYFQGSQLLDIELRRLFWPLAIPQLGFEVPEIDTHWDFMFQGVSLFPPGVNQSGSL